ncbi:MAG TPA: phosphoribosyltransferase [Longimicrobiales bacterium]|nr:phosphoribosyltransferase [Longimicrobiales bacterium]
MIFRDRAEAGRRLADRLTAFRGRDDVVVLALPRGGLPVGREVANAIGAPLDVMLVRKLGYPGQEELAMGAIASGGVRMINQEVVDLLGVTEHTLAAVAATEQVELERREREYRGDRPAAELAGRIVILVDDGLATGSSMQAAAEAVRAQSPARVIVAVPVAPAETCERFRTIVDDVICLETPEPFHAVGLWYEDFSQVSDSDVRAILADSRPPPPPATD